MRPALALLVVGTACGRIGFDHAAGGGDGPPDGAAMTPPGLACSETRSLGAAGITGVALQAVATARGLAALWLDPGGVLRGATWATDAGGAVIAGSTVEIAPGPFEQLWVAANGDEILAATQGGTSVTARILRGDLTTLVPEAGMGTGTFEGRDPLAARRGRPGFVAIAAAGAAPAIYEVDGASTPTPHPLAALAAHGAASIAADADGYAVITEHADQYGPGCWYSKVDDAFALASGPGSLESTQQADCDSSTVSASAGPMGAGVAWMDRDPINAYVEFRGTISGGNVASLSGETGTAQPLVTATSTGFAALYRSSAGLRAFDAAGSRTLSATAVLADLVTWADRALVLWTTPAGAPQLTRLCP